MKDLYQILGLTNQASEEDIKKAYRQLAMQLHPDRNPGDKEAEERFKEVQQAYSTLSDPPKRAEYDNPSKPFTSVFEDVMSAFRRNPFRQQGQPKATNAYVEVTLTLEQVKSGGDMNITYFRQSPCIHCNGAGGSSAPCTPCNGTGWMSRNVQNMTISSDCKSCGGKGKVLSEACLECEGAGTYLSEDKFEWQIPLGAEDGMVFVRTDMGNTGMGCRNGDLHIRVRVVPHPYFQRYPNGDLVYALPVSYTQLVFGDSVSVPLLGGGQIDLKIPPGTQIGTRLRMGNMGLPIFNNRRDTYQSGNLIVQPILEVPVAPQARLKEVLEDLVELERQNLTPLRAKHLEQIGKNDRTQE